ncbi:hypothetical protein [Subtercola boreus]|nr:hypothetical protein [Subtercola boreus]
MIVCITNDIPELRSCTIRGEHLDNCSGFVVRFDYRTNQVTHTNVECRGCLPYPAEHGFLCGSCAEKLDAALAGSVDLISHLRSIESGPRDQTPTRAAPGSRVIVPASWMEADELYIALSAAAVAYSVDWQVEEPERDVTASSLNGFNPEANIEAVWFVTEMLTKYVQASLPNLIAKVEGAIRSVEYIAKVQTAMARFPFDEAPQRVHYVRCRTCQHMTLNRRPPLEYNGPVVVECSNEDCKALWDPRLIDFDLQLLRVEVQEAALANARRQRIADRDAAREANKLRRQAVRDAEKAAELEAASVPI